MHHILVPLDGSPAAEAVLPAAIAMAAACHARLTLFHVVEKDGADRIHGQPHLTDGDAAQVYLQTVARLRAFNGLAVEVHVHRTQAADVAASVVDHAEELHADLVVLATHGRGGLRHFLFSRVAARAVERGTTPVLLIQPPAEAAAAAFRCRSILVPLDGVGDRHESAAVPMAAELAEGFQAAVSLLAVVPTPATLSGSAAATASFLPLVTREVLNLAERQAAAYVDRTAESLTAKGISATGYISRGEPIGALVEAVQALQSDLVVMAAPGKPAAEAVWSGSLTARALEALDRPLLVMPTARFPAGQRDLSEHAQEGR
ncbi:MAG TPA: universal stress protein [Candidatus Sulfotelmatobacter sp.]|nr:universal stress protein [Candidatus Sulfotelmatobacter sp.]